MLTTDAFVAFLAILAGSPVLATAIQPHHKYEHEEYNKRFEKRSGHPGVYICTGSNFSGKCYWEESVVGYCHNYWLGPSTSFGPDIDLVCYIFTTNNCKGNSFSIMQPGSKKIEFTGKSWKCAYTGG